MTRPAKAVARGHGRPAGHTETPGLEPGAFRISLTVEVVRRRATATRFAIADLRFAAWLVWMTPLLTALSSLREASSISAVAFSTSPASAASWNFRTAVFSDDLTDLLRSRRFSFCRLRLIWDLMFATRQPRLDSSGWSAYCAR